MAERNSLWRVTSVFAGAVLLADVAIVFGFFPWNTDPQGDQSSSGAAKACYAKAYSEESSTNANLKVDFAPLSAKDQFYVDTARKTAIEFGIPDLVKKFVSKTGLKDKRVLEIGAGSGSLQDAVKDYTGLDISPTARRFFHKPFVEASATDMPFPDNSFDGAWSIWVLEHIPNPERALLEMRRVLKEGGYLLLFPAPNVSRYAAQGYEVRPYRDFDWNGKLIKATAPVVESGAFRYLQFHQEHLLRQASVRLTGGPSRLHFIRLTPNYDQYWVPDSDATTSVSLQELYLWFTSRGDVCLNCPSGGIRPLEGLFIQIRKH
jgi:ubiquinone/menaquinone biosynthesis C-methylase UbiE